jgi:hypothetical protein
MYGTVASAEWEQEWLYRGTEIPTFSRQAEEEIQSLSIKLDPTYRYLSQITKLHVMTALLLSQNHAIRVIEVITEQAFSLIMHKFFDQYIKKEESSRLVMKE